MASERASGSRPFSAHRAHHLRIVGDGLRQLDAPAACLCYRRHVRWAASDKPTSSNAAKVRWFALGVAHPENAQVRVDELVSGEPLGKGRTGRQ